jgi:hypothetical protein
MTTTTGAGTCLSVSAAQPATHDETGFAALTWTQVGELESVAEIMVAHTSSSFTNLCTGKTSVNKGAEEAVTANVVCALDREDAGQALMTTGRKSLTAIYSFRVAESNGDIVYFQAHVMSERITGGSGVNDTKMGGYSLGVKAQPAADTFIVVLAP